MSNEEIIQGNKLIAEFMGAIEVDPLGNLERNIYFKLPVDHIYTYNETGLKYHSSWDWLMPVVKKIRSLKSSMATSQKLHWGRRNGAIGHALLDSLDVYKTWLKVVQFIQWYNQQTK